MAKELEDLHKLRLVAEGREANIKLKLRMQERHSKGKTVESVAGLSLSKLCMRDTGSSFVELEEELTVTWSSWDALQGKVDSVLVSFEPDGSVFGRR